MKVKLIAVGTKMPAWVDMAYKEYAQRMPAVCQLDLREIPALKRGKNADTVRILRDEAAAIKTVIPDDFFTIALDRKGKQLDTLALSRSMQNWIDDSQNIAIIIGGPEGLCPEFLQSVNAQWSLSAMTFAHPVVRVMLAEQLYRSWSILANLPYHRGD